MFDPYQQWLGIPYGQRPPTYYQLLGISPQETDGEVIKEAALRRTSHIRYFQLGPHAQECTGLLNEIAQARAVLLNPADRTEYDAPPAQISTPNNNQPDTGSPEPCPTAGGGIGNPFDFPGTDETFTEPVVPFAAL